MSESSTPATSAQSASSDQRSVVKAAGIIGIGTFASRILGFIRDMVMAGLFGATAAADAFYVAFRVPSLLREIGRAHI